MSHYVECDVCEIRDPDALILALMECGFPRHHIEVHDNPVPLYGYEGDQRPEKSHIVIRRVHVGSVANDVGFERQADGTYVARISEFDMNHRFNENTRSRLRQEYAYHRLARSQTAVGRGVSRVVQQDGSIRCVIRGFR